MGNICPRRCIAQLGSRLGVFLTHRFHQLLLLLLLLQLFYCTLREPLPPTNRSIPRRPARDHPQSRGTSPWQWVPVGVASVPQPRVRERHHECHRDLAATASVTALVTHRAKLSRLPVESKREMRAFTLVLLLSCSKSKKILLVIKLQIYDMLKINKINLKQLKKQKKNTKQKKKKFFLRFWG